MKEKYHARATRHDSKQGAPRQEISKKESGEEKGDPYLVVPSKSDGGSAVESKFGGRTSSTLLKHPPNWDKSISNPRTLEKQYKRYEPINRIHRTSR